MDNHLEKLLEDFFSIKISISNNGERYRESLGVALSPSCTSLSHAIGKIQSGAGSGSGRWVLEILSSARKNVSAQITY